MPQSQQRRILLQVTELEDRSTPASLDGLDPSLYSSSHVIVKYKPGAILNIASVNSLGKDTGVYTAPVIQGQTVQETLNFYKSLPGVAYAEADYIYQLDTVPNDPSFNDGSLWGLNNVGQNSGTPDADIDAPEAWNIRTSAANVVVGVIDSGIDYTHPDLIDNMWHNPGEIANNGIDDDNNGYIDDYYGYDFINGDSDPMDDFGHGTHCSGTIAGQGDNSLGVTGVAWDAQLMALKIFNAAGQTTTAAIVAAINYATQMGADLTSNSWGGGGYSQAVYDAIKRARSAGQLFVNSAGNSSRNIDVFSNYPSNYNLDNIIVVAATDRNDQLAWFSNYGAKNVDLAAPGVEIYSTVPVSMGSYATYSGTSMAAPHVAGAIALLKAQYPNENYLQIRARLLNGTEATPATVGTTFSGGRLNLANLLDPSRVKVNRIQAIESTSGAITKIRVYFSTGMNLATLTPSNFRIFNNLGANVRVTRVSAVTPTKSVVDLSITPQILNTVPTAMGNMQGLTVTVVPNVKNQFGQKLNQDEDAVGGETNADFFGGSVYTINQFSGGVIQDNSNTNFALPDPNNLFITDVNARINLTHSRLSDLKLSLKAPTSNSVLLFNNQGGYGTQLVNTRFDSQSSSVLSSDSVSPFTGVYKSYESLDSIQGNVANGNWILNAADMYAGATGQLNSFGITASTVNRGVNLAVSSVTPVGDTSSTLAPQYNGFTVQFNQPVNITSVSKSDFKLYDPLNRLVTILGVDLLTDGSNNTFRITTVPLLRAGNYTLRISQTIATPLGIGMDSNSNGIFGEVSDFSSTIVNIPASTFSNSNKLGIQDLKIVSNNIVINRNIQIDKIALELNIDHTYDSNMNITLTSPDGLTYQVFQSKGTFGDNLTRTILSDDASTALADGTAPFRGEFKPDQSLANLIGTNAIGTWSLSIQDTVLGNTGILNSWSLYITPASGSGS